METHMVMLQDNELVLLDGHCRREIQLTVDEAKARLAVVQAQPDLPVGLANLIADVVRIARTEGRLSYGTTQLDTCQICGAKMTYGKYQRDSRYHRKGDTDWKKPYYLYGVDLARAFIYVVGSPRVGCCMECWNKYKTVIAVALEDVEAEIPEQITGHPPKYRYYENMKCTKCGWTGHQGDMIRHPVMIGSGTYPAVCPKCHAENGMFRTPVERTGTHILVKV